MSGMNPWGNFFAGFLNPGTDQQTGQAMNSWKAGALAASEGYDKFVQDQEHTVDGSILGELRVSRFLLEQLLPKLHITSFRPGHLENPYQLPQKYGRW